MKMDTRIHRCDILATWNCKHIANANKLPHIRRVNALLGLETPVLAAPLELLDKDDENTVWNGCAKSAARWRKNSTMIPRKRASTIARWRVARALNFISARINS